MAETLDTRHQSPIDGDDKDVLLCAKSLVSCPVPGMERGGGGGGGGCGIRFQ